MIRFERANLIHALPRQQFDLVLCRNVLIYFEAQTRDTVLSHLAQTVVPGGYLALGYSERVPTDHEDLLPIRTGESVLYRRPHREDPIPTSTRTPPRRRSTLPPPPAPARAADTPLASLNGELSGPEGERRARSVVARLLQSDSPAVIDLRGLRFADEGVARQLARGARALTDQGRTLVLVTTNPGVSRFLRRYAIAPPAQLRSQVPTPAAPEPR